MKRTRTEHDKAERAQKDRATYQRLLAAGVCPRCTRPLDRTDRKRCAACRKVARQTACQRRLREGRFPLGLYREHRLDCVSLGVTRDDDEATGTYAVTATYLEPHLRGGGAGRLVLTGLKLEQLRGVLGMCRLMGPVDRSRCLPPLVTEAMGMMANEEASEQLEPVERRLRLVV